MGTKTILQKIASLEYYNGLMDVKEILKSIYSSVTTLETNKVFVGEFDVSRATLVQGTPFVVGQKYIVYTLQAGDDFSNIGYVSSDEFFVATGTTPTVWSNSTSVEVQNEILIPYFNDLDSSIYLNFFGTSYLEIKSPNSAFTMGKTFPNIVGGSQVDIKDNQTISFSAQISPKYIKIEVYN